MDPVLWQVFEIVLLTLGVIGYFILSILNGFAYVSCSVYGNDCRKAGIFTTILVIPIILGGINLVFLYVLGLIIAITAYYG